MHKIRTLFSFGPSVLKLMSKAFPGIMEDEREVIVTQDQVDRIASCMHGCRIVDNSMFNPKAETVIKMTSGGLIELTVSCKSSERIYSFNDFLQGHSLDYFGYYKQDGIDTWGDYTWHFAPESSIVFTLDDDCMYSDIDTLMGDGAQDKLLEKTNGILPIYISSPNGQMLNVNIKVIANRAIALV